MARKQEAGAAPPRRLNIAGLEAVAVDWSFVEAREGGVRVDGYVPRDRSGAVIGQSGVTVGCGVDLGQQAAATLAGWGADDALVGKVRRYLGLRGTAAVDALRAAPLTLTQAEAALLTAGAEHATLADIVSRYALMAGGRKFASLSPGAQTAIVSVAYQYGTRLDLRTPRLWSRALRGDEAAMAAELRDFGDAYKSRRHLEADLIEGRRGV